MTAHNGQAFIKEAIDSLLGQTYSDFELIIVNDGSTDQTESILKSYKDERIIVLKNEENLGISASRNKGIKLAKGAYIAFMDSDDISMPWRFDKQYAFMENHPDIDICGSSAEYFGQKTAAVPAFVTHNEIFTGLFFGCCMVQSSIIMRKKSIFSINNFYDTQFDYAEDYEFWIRLALKGLQFANLKEVLVRYRWHGANASVTHRDKQKRHTQQALMYFMNRLSIAQPEMKVRTHSLLRYGKKLNRESIEQVIRWIDEMLEANRNAGLFHDGLLKANTAERLFKVVYSSCHHGLWLWRYYYMQPVTSYYKICIKKQVKFLFRCILRVNSSSDLFDS